MTEPPQPRPAPPEPDPPGPGARRAAAPPVTVAVAAARPGGSDDQAGLLARLRAGDQRAFAELVDTWSPVMLRVAMLHVSSRASAEEVVQETWLAVVRQLDRFEGRSSLRTWAFRILENLARTRGRREARTLPWSSAFPGDGEGDGGGPTVDPARFRGAGDRWPRHWTDAGAPVAWEPPPEDAAVAAEVRRELRAALDELPPRQRAVVELRDVLGLSSDEVCARLALTPGNQRILLHRGRARLRARLEGLYRGRTEGDGGG
ncbi:RNA polymerase sigma factor [Geodermatophilus marinus]|uniref:RNA polymerase sigma factor n=1 Tax=Geodermatophilus sp. LHW52908 TaxID=2303986 RepID=UPI000E3DCF75|nr:sigma-70 family RNA polymerase sigma factor [Geodermatophilus sp. LHW52908]RFU21570.1 sigma-70 family RNA polymerase sigma factor [Geodermatophilus sp. LHW52908]